MNKILKSAITVFGLLSFSGFVLGYYIFELLRPKMVRFESITPAEEGLLNYFGIALLLFIIFCLLSFYRLIRHIKNARKITLLYLFLLATLVLSMLFIFGDLALLSDIGKQYKYGLSQPEWVVLYIIVAFQAFSALIITYANIFKLKNKERVKHISRDSNIFLAAQYVGALCGFIGLSFTALNFLFLRPLWMIKQHITITAVFLLVPYVLIVFYWFVVKYQEKTRQLYDEKQLQDLGKSALLTLLLSVVVMGLLFGLNFNNLDSTISVLWFPFYLFLVLFLFSTGNLYLGRR